MSKKYARMSSIDRFSSLPDDVAHEIIMYLFMDDTCRLSVVSRRCRQLCISTPSLSVDMGPYPEEKTIQNQIMNYVDRLLLLRRGMVTQRFYIFWCIETETSFKYGGVKEEEDRILSWLHNAMISKVKEVVLILEPKRGSELALPPSLLCSMSLESLTVDIHVDGILKLPSYSSIVFSSLKYLKLSSLRIEESFCYWVSTACKFLEELHLMKIRETKSIVIDSSSLKGLHMSSMDEELCHLSTPQLQLFALKGNILSFPLEQNLACLKSTGSVLCPSSASILSRGLDQIRLCCDLCHIKGLDLSDLSNHELLWEFSDWGKLPIFFTSLLSLHVLTTWIYFLMPIMESLFKGGAPCRYLYIWSKVLPSHSEEIEREDRESTKYCEVQNGTTFVQSLKFATIELFSDQEELELSVIKYLLENARYLQKMTILYASPLGSDVIEEIMECEKASADVAVKFHMM